MSAVKVDLTPCPSWCAQKGSEREDGWHGPVHSSWSIRISNDLWVNADREAARGPEVNRVTMTDGDSMLFGLPPGEARSLAAALIRAADLLEGPAGV